MFENILETLIDLFFSMFELLILPFLFMWEMFWPGVTGIFDDLIYWTQEFLTDTLLQIVVDLIPLPLVAFMNQPAITDLINIAGDVLWFIPLIPVLGIYSTAYSLAATIRLIRFVIGWLPTIEG